MPEKVNNPILLGYGDMFGKHESVIDQTNKALAPLLVSEISSIDNIKIKEIKIINHNIRNVKVIMRDLDNPIHSVPYYLGELTIEVLVNKLSKPIKIDVGVVVFFEKISNLQLNTSGFVGVNDLNMDFLINDYNHISDDTLILMPGMQSKISLWDFLRFAKKDINNQLVEMLKEKINRTSTLREDIIKKYKNFQFNMEMLFEQDKNIKQIFDKLYVSTLTSLSIKKRKTYLDSDMFYFDIGERYRENIIHNSPYRKYFMDELMLYEAGYSLHPSQGIGKYIGDIVMDIGCGTGEKGIHLLQKVMRDDIEKKERCYIGFDSNALAIYDANYNTFTRMMTMNERDGKYEIVPTIENNQNDKHKITYLFSEGRMNDIIDDTIKFCCLDNVKPGLGMLQRKVFSEVSEEVGTQEPTIEKFDHYKDIFERDQKVEDEKAELLEKMNALGEKFPGMNQQEERKKTIKEVRALYEQRQEKKEVSINGEAFKKARKTILMPGGTFGNFMQDDEGLNLYIRALEQNIQEYENKKGMFVKAGKWNQKYEKECMMHVDSLRIVIQDMKNKNNTKRMFLDDIKQILSNQDGDYALVTVFTKPNKSDKDYHKKTREIEKIYNTDAFKQKYLSLFRRMNIDEKDLEYSAKYEKDDKVHMYVKVINPRGVFYPIVSGNQSSLTDEELKDKIAYRKGRSIGSDLPMGFIFHCQVSQRFSDDDMENIVEKDAQGNPTGLWVIDQIVHPEVKDMKIFVIALSTDKK